MKTTQLNNYKTRIYNYIIVYDHYKQFQMCLSQYYESIIKSARDNSLAKRECNEMSFFTALLQSAILVTV